MRSAIIHGNQVSWHLDSDFGQVTNCTRPVVGSPSGAIGKWGETIARNYLVERGTRTVKHARFGLPSRSLTVDLYDPKSRAAYEVKTGLGPREPNFRPRIRPYALLRDSGLVDKVVFFHVSLGGLSCVSFSQWAEIRAAGLEVIDIAV